MVGSIYSKDIIQQVILNNMENKDPISVFTDKEEEYIQRYKISHPNAELSFHDKLELANEYRKNCRCLINKV